jgi:hypothetical protein
VDDTRLDDLLDRTEILDVFARYALGMDRGDRELFASVWAEDAVWECASIGMDLHGREAILGYFERGPGSAPPAPTSGSAMRLASNHHIKLDGDRATSVAEMAAFRFTGHVVHPYSVGVYEDEFVRTADGWRIARRNMVVSPVVPAPGPVAGP